MQLMTGIVRRFPRLSQATEPSDHDASVSARDASTKTRSCSSSPALLPQTSSCASTMQSPQKPFGFLEGTTNSYDYVRNDPVNFIDPLGPAPVAASPNPFAYGPRRLVAASGRARSILRMPCGADCSFNE